MKSFFLYFSLATFIDCSHHRRRGQHDMSQFAMPWPGGINNLKIWDCKSLHPDNSKGDTHTLCLKRSPLNKSPAGYQISTKQKNLFLNRHNYHRARSNPSSSNMQKTYWDNDLQELAQAWAEQCHWNHDKNRYSQTHRETPGQNMAKGFQSITEAVDAWYDEIKDYGYGKGRITPGAKIGHYTQMMQSGVAKLGCGIADCEVAKDRVVKFHVCEYLEHNKRINFPFASGPRCQDCPLSCNRNLCDCRGKYCINGGTLDVNKCKCRCPAMWKGKECEINARADFCSSVIQDKKFCVTYENNATYYCREYSNVPSDCPYLCKICSECNGKYCYNGGTLDRNSCTCHCPVIFGGLTCKTLHCPHIESPSWCSRPQSDCQKYYNIPNKCPYLCGLCKGKKPPCEKDPNCNKSKYGCVVSGRLLKKSLCMSIKDVKSCKSISCTYCMYENMRRECPHRCGWCRE